ncbi:DNA-formamidopyrimidine glycosylase, partial [Enterococcus faecium]
MGPEPLGPALSASYLAQALAGRIAPIKAMLLDQRNVAGLGNIYVCEALHLAGIAPATPAGTITVRRLKRLVDAIRAVLAAAI